MASRLKNWILKKSSSKSDGHGHRRRGSYERPKSSDSHVPVTYAGSNYPRANNIDIHHGGTIQTRKENERPHTAHPKSSEGPIVPGNRRNTARSRENNGRPRTAPSGEQPQGGSIVNFSRTFSGIAAKSSPFLRRKKPTHSQRSFSESTTPISSHQQTSAHPLPPKTTFFAYGSTEPPFALPVPPFVQNHERSSSISSRASQNSYIDVLDAHDNIQSDNDASRIRAIADGSRIHGEDVANRNMATPVGGSSRSNQSNFQASYLESIYHDVAGAEEEESNSSRLCSDGSIPRNDDMMVIRQPSSRTQPVSKSITCPSKSRPETVLDSPFDHSATTCQNHDRLSTAYNDIACNPDCHHRGWSNSSIYTSSLREARRQRFLSTQPPQRGKSKKFYSSPTTDMMKETRRTGSANGRSTAGTSHATSTGNPERQDDLSMSNDVYDMISDRTPRTMPSPPSKYSKFSSTTEKRAETAVNKDDMHINGTKFPITDGQKHTTSPITDNFGKKKSYLVEERAEPINLKGVVDLTNSVDTTVHETVAPAVIHEHVVPTKHEIITREIFREIHQHHYYYRTLPVIDTEILPAKHYVYGEDGDTLIRIPESMLPAHTVTGSHTQSWSIVQNRPAPTQDPFDSPLFGVEPELPNTKYKVLSRPNSKGQLQWSHVPGEPVKVMEREYITAEGIPRKETWWRYPPALATAAYEAGVTVPMYWDHVPAGKERAVTKTPETPASTPQNEISQKKKIKELRDLERAQANDYKSADHINRDMEKLRKKKLYTGLSNSDSTHARELNGVHSPPPLPRKPVPQNTYERPPTRDSGYGGLSSVASSLTNGHSHARHSSGSSISSLLGRVRGDDGRQSVPVEGEATRYLHRMREKRKSLSSPTGTGRTFPERVNGESGRSGEDARRRSHDVYKAPVLADRTKKTEYLFGVATPK